MSQRSTENQGGFEPPVDPGEDPFDRSSPEQAADLEIDLSVLDAVWARKPAPAPSRVAVPDHEPPRGAPVQDPAEAAPEPQGIGGDGAEREDAGDEAVGLDPVGPEGPPWAEAGDSREAVGDDGAVEDQLRRRIRDLLAEAQVAAGQGQRDEALGILARIAILDEENEDARKLEESLRQEIDRQGREIEHWLTEGVQWLEEGRLEEALDRFRRVLEKAPQHAEAKAYAAEAEKRRARGGAQEDPTPPTAAVPGDPDRAPHPAPAAAAQEPVAESVPLAKRAGILREAAEPVMRTVPVPSGPTRRRIGPRAVMIAGVGVVALIAAAAAVWLGLGGGGAPGTAAPADGPAIPTSTAADGPAAAGQIRAVETGASLPLPERAERIERAMARATDATAREDHAAAILAYNEVLALDPNHQEARAKLLEAGEAYREQRAVLDQIEKARAAFAEGEYSTALRLYYRLPAGSIDAETVDRYKFNGWFNLAVAALQAGDTRQAIANLDEALALRGTEADARRLREFAASYEAQTKDRRYYAEVGSLTFRALED